MPEIDTVRALRSAAAYPHLVAPGAAIGFLQTHISSLFFVGRRVFKLKKPVDLGFLDFSTLEKRRHFCEEEVRLNRRLTPEVYVGVVPIVRTPEGVRVATEAPSPEEVIVDYAVEMERLPAAAMMDARLARGEIDNAYLGAIAERLAAFHARAATGEGVDEYGALDRLTENADENFRQLAPFAGVDAVVRTLSPTLHGFLAERAHRCLAERADVFRERVRRGRIREGHGDLHTGNICIRDDGTIAIYDCIEFTRRFRCADVAADLAFLAMDLDSRGFRGFAGYLSRQYADAAADATFADVFDYYKSYSAIVRGKVASLTASDPLSSDDARDAQVARARACLQLAATYSLPGALILTCGLPGSGKSWAARHAARPFQALVVRSDVVRKTLHGLAPTARADVGIDRALYDPPATKRTYDAMLERAVEGLEAGRTVVVDAMFATAAHRRRFVAAAGAHPVLVVHITCDEPTIRARLHARMRRGDDPSDADEAVFDALRERFEPPDELPATARLDFASESETAEGLSGVVIDRLISLATAETAPESDRPLP